MGKKVSSSAGSREEGFALILAILALMLLTFLGLTLATSTSQELQIATNYRWNQQAFYNAEAGIEVGKALLRDITWGDSMPQKRTTTWTANTTPVKRTDTACNNCGASQDSAQRPLRHYENGECDVAGSGTGFGLVFNDGTAPYQYVSSAFGHNINGSFTIWLRRKVEVADGVFQDTASNDLLVMTVEGVAPYESRSTSPDAVATAKLSQTHRAVKFLEFELAREDRENTICGTRAGQAGGGPEGANFGGCVAMEAKRVSEGLGTSQSFTDNGAK